VYILLAHNNNENDIFTGVDDINLLEEMRKLSVTKEVLVSKDIGDDGIGDEDWSVVSAQGSVIEI